MKLVFGSPVRPTFISADYGSWHDFKQGRALRQRRFLQRILWWFGLSLNSGLFVGVLRHESGGMEVHDQEAEKP